MLKTILFDIGGVLTPDPYETIILHEQKGIGRHLGLTEKELVARVRHIWDKFSISPDGKEQDFWHEVSNVLQISIRIKDIEEIKHEVVVVNPEAATVFELLRIRGIKIGIISNNTAFFYSFQAKKLLLKDHVDPMLVFLSNDKKVSKVDGLFEIAARSVSPQTTLVIDDRQENVEKAKQLGFQAIHYSMNQSLLSLVTKALHIPIT